jgi:hypothetical protein
MFVFIDTTETHNNPGLRGPNWEKLAHFLTNRSHQGFLPRIVFLETVGHVQRSIDTARRQVNSAVENLNKLCLQGDLKSVDGTPINESFLTARLRAVGVKICEHKEVSIDKIVGRAISRLKPFDSEGRKGFRDALIWESMLKVLTGQSAEAVLISNNSTDFGTGNVIPEEMRADLESVGFTGKYSVTRTLSFFVEEHVDQTLELAADVAERVANNTYRWLDVSKFLLNHLQELRSAVRRYVDVVYGRVPVMVAGAEFVGLSMTSLRSAGAPLSVTARHLDEEVVSVTARFNANLLITATHWQPLGIPAVGDVFLNAESDFELTVVVNERAGDITDFAFDVRSLKLAPADDVSFNSTIWGPYSPYFWQRNISALNWIPEIRLSD